MSLLNDRVYDTNVGKTGTSLDRIRSTFHQLYEKNQTNFNVFELGHGDNWSTFISGFDIAFFNQATIYSPNPEILEEATGIFRIKNLLNTVMLGGPGLAHAERLKQRGYAQKDSAPMMAYSLTAADSDYELPQGLSMQRVITSEQLEVAKEVFSEGFGIPMEVSTAYLEMTFGSPNVFRYYLLDGDTPVSTSVFIRDGRFLGCFDVATPARHQRKGYGEALMKAMFAAHATMKDELVVLQASKPGEVLYRRMGYQIIDYTQWWFLEDQKMLRRFEDLELEIGPYKLRQLTAEDKDLVIEKYNESEIQKWMGLPIPFDEKAYEGWLSYFEASRRDGQAIWWMIERDGLCLGTFWFHHQNWKLDIAEIGYLAFSEARGQGMIPFLVRELAVKLLTEYKMERVEIFTDSRNDNSGRAALKAGFTLEGVRRRGGRNRAEVNDIKVYSLIASDLT